MSERGLKNLIEKGDRGDIVLLGFPHDAGVRINGGRPGAARGPQAFRSALGRIRSASDPELDVDLSILKICDAGDVSPICSLEESHAALTDKVGAILETGSIPFVVGGGNDQSYPNASALLGREDALPLGVVNVDAHLDARPLKDGRAHSGSPFRLLLQDERFEADCFVEFAAQGEQCDRDQAEFIKSRGGRIHWLTAMQEEACVAAMFRVVLEDLTEQCASVFVSFDLDSVSGSTAPGVSCPGAIGLSAREALAIARIAGACPAVRLFDLSEFNPEIEEDRTGRLAASLFYNFCLALAARKKKA